MLNRLARPAMIAAAAAAAITAMPVAASAQSHAFQGRGHVPGYGGQTYNHAEFCQRDRQGRTGTGALVGAGAGAVFGSQLAARGRRTEGSILGGVVGAVIGSVAGRGSSVRCEDQISRNAYTYSPNIPAYARDRGFPGGQSHSSGPAYTPGPGHGSGFERHSSGHASPYGFGSGHAQGYHSAQSGSSVYYDEDGYGPFASPQRDSGHYNRGPGRYDRGDACRLAESHIRMPDGRRETRYVRTCPDASGRYRIVD